MIVRMGMWILMTFEGGFSARWDGEKGVECSISWPLTLLRSIRKASRYAVCLARLAAYELRAWHDSTSTGRGYSSILTPEGERREGFCNRVAGWLALEGVDETNDMTSTCF